MPTSTFFVSITNIFVQPQNMLGEAHSFLDQAQQFFSQPQGSSPKYVPQTFLESTGDIRQTTKPTTSKLTTQPQKKC